jgi:4-diphosphocytidyl-2-C-methyl-D-erythritol kinase
VTAQPNSVTVRVPAKVNLQLSVGPRRDDGYHDLVNVFHAVSLFDEVTAAEADTVTVTVEGTGAGSVPLGDDNLAVRAVRALARQTGTPYGAALRIRKTIPVAGGMAGGSADAAATLVACNDLWSLGLARDDLLEIAAELGSDVPFALIGGTAIGTGRGEVLTPALVTGRFHWVFALDHAGLSTAAVYAEADRIRDTTSWRPAPPELDDKLMAALRAGDAAALGQSLTNDLEPAALLLRRSLARTLATGRRHGALGAIVSGSGPTCAFLAESEPHAHSLADALATICDAALIAHGPVPGTTIL